MNNPVTVISYKKHLLMVETFHKKQDALQKGHKL